MLDGVLERNDDYLNLVYDKGIHLSKILDDLVSLSDLENNGSKFDFEKVHVKQYVHQIYEKLNLVLEKQGVIFLLKDNLPSSDENIYVLIDQMRIEQVIVNLVNNAVRFIDKEEGQIILKLDKKDDLHVIISICDNGIGIRENDLKYIFNRFYSRDTPNSNYRGAGLGLAISKEIVERHRGKIWVESVYGKGASFYIELPTTS